MGRVSAFLGMVLYMYPEKNGRHNRPHIHVMYGDDECVLSIPEFCLGLPIRTAGEIRSPRLWGRRPQYHFYLRFKAERSDF